MPSDPAEHVLTGFSAIFFFEVYERSDTYLTFYSAIKQRFS